MDKPCFYFSNNPSVCVDGCSTKVDPWEECRYGRLSPDYEAHKNPKLSKAQKISEKIVEWAKHSRC